MDRINISPVVILAALAGAAVMSIAIAAWGATHPHPTAAAPNVPYRLPAPPSAGARGAPSMAEVQQGFGALVAAIRPAVVSIAARRPVAPMAPGTGMQFLDPFPGPRTVVGSGVIVHPDGLILTSRQVAGEAELLQASFFRADRRPLSARRIAADTATDLALYRVAAPGRLPFARLGDSSGVRSGDIVVAIGSPFGLTETVTHGIVSATRRAVTVEGRVLTDVIQTDAAINQGNAGGPLVDIQAAVIGINVAIFSTDATFSGIGFAIPSNLAALFIQRAIGVRG